LSRDNYARGILLLVNERPRRTQAERVEASGRRLLQAAAELISERGWAGASAAEIGRRAGYSRGMVGARFGTKEALLDELLASEYESRLNPDAPDAMPGLERVMLPLRRIQDLYHEDRAFLEAIFVLNFEAVSRATPLRPRIADWAGRIVQAVEDGLRVGLEDGSVRADLDVSTAANDIAARTIGVAYGWIMLPARFDLDAELGRICAAIEVEAGPERRAPR
jgi:AcrR family transcriptional regulator